jgi:phospholipid-binding lipoprotein MlaA
LLFLSASPAAACTSAEVTPVAEPNAADQAQAPLDRGDPWEKQNRRNYNFSEKVDRHVFLPISNVYQKSPGGIREGLRHFVNNLGEPVTAVNDLMQFRVRAASVTVLRFAANSTVGLLGFLDIAGKSGLPGHSNGFANTLGHYGVGPGPYIYMPILGPSTVRDAIGSGVDSMMSPVTLARFAYITPLRAGITVVSGVDTRARAEPQLEALNTTADDPYATLRSAYLQNREAEIKGEVALEQKEPLPDFDDPGEAKGKDGKSRPVVATPASAAPAAPQTPALPGAETTPEAPPAAAQPTQSAPAATVSTGPTAELGSTDTAQMRHNVSESRSLSTEK